MATKVNTSPKKSVEDTSLTWKRSPQCCVCHNQSNTTIYLVCESGHVICENCQHTDCRQHIKEGGDGVSFKDFHRIPWEPQNNNMGTMGTTSAMSGDFAGGDHETPLKISSKKIDKPKHDRKTKLFNDALARAIACIPEEDNMNELPEDEEPVVTYKNVNFNLDDTVSCTSYDVSDNDLEIELLGPPEDHKRSFPRPVLCPVQECRRNIALDSVMLHFYFDHAKIPRTIIKSRAPHKMTLKPCHLLAKTQCLGIFLLENKNRTNSQHRIDSSSRLQQTYMECKSFMLMGARIALEGLKYDARAQKEIVNASHSIKKKRTKSGKHSCCRPEPSECFDFFEDHEVLALWCCKLDNNTDRCSITLMRNDKKECFNYVGEAIHIRNDQSAMMMYARCDCLLIRGAAANRLIDEENQITVLINILE